MASEYMPSGFATFYRAVHVIGFVVGATLIWFLGFPIIEAIAGVLRIVFANGTDRGAWQGVLYRSLNWAVVLAIPGAVLWGIWVLGFYQLGVNFYAISWAIGVPAHLLAASWYVPLIYRWYRMAQSHSAH